VQVGDIIEHRYRQDKVGFVTKLKPVDVGKNGEHRIWDALVEWADGSNGWVAVAHIKPYADE
tara:strand:- start:302 stop:487 length:186 start_codon:yes stop_codon:yes gene_type:complete